MPRLWLAALLPLLGCTLAAESAARPEALAALSPTGTREEMKELAPGLMVTSQIALTDVERLAAAGVKTLIMNRPDGEEPGQPTAAALRAAAEAHGLSFHHIPVSGGHFPAEAVAAMAAALEGSKGPVVAFCRSGARSATLWALGRAGKDPPDAIVAAGQRVGIDLAPLRSRLQPQGEPWP